MVGRLVCIVGGLFELLFQTVLREVDVDVNLNKVNKTFNLAIKVLPTFDKEKYSKWKFHRLLKFSKEVQIYLDIADPMDR